MTVEKVMQLFLEVIFVANVYKIIVCYSTVAIIIASNKLKLYYSLHI